LLKGAVNSIINKETDRNKHREFKHDGDDNYEEEIEG
jgi:hypothetical protein